MNDSYLPGRPGAGRLFGRVVRRVIGLVLLCVAIGYSSCQALEATRSFAAERDTTVMEINVNG